MSSWICWCGTVNEQFLDDYESVIEFYIRKANPEKFRAAFSFKRNIWSSCLSTVAFHHRWRIKKLFSKCDCAHQIGNSIVLHGSWDGWLCVRWCCRPWKAHCLEIFTLSDVCDLLWTFEGLDWWRHSEAAWVCSKGYRSFSSASWYAICCCSARRIINSLQTKQLGAFGWFPEIRVLDLAKCYCSCQQLDLFTDVACAWPWKSNDKTCADVNMRHVIKHAPT